MFIKHSNISTQKVKELFVSQYRRRILPRGCTDCLQDVGDQCHDQSPGWRCTHTISSTTQWHASYYPCNDPVHAPANHHVMNPEQTAELLSGHRYHPSAVRIINLIYCQLLWHSLQCHTSQKSHLVSACVLVPLEIYTARSLFTYLKNPCSIDVFIYIVVQ